MLAVENRLFSQADLEKFNGPFAATLARRIADLFEIPVSDLMPTRILDYGQPRTIFPKRTFFGIQLEQAEFSIEQADENIRIVIQNFKEPIPSDFVEFLKESAVGAILAGGIAVRFLDAPEFRLLIDDLVIQHVNEDLGTNY